MKKRKIKKMTIKDLSIDYVNTIDYDENGREIHSKNSSGFEDWTEYDKNGNQIHYKDSDGYETWDTYN